MNISAICEAKRQRYPANHTLLVMVDGIISEDLSDEIPATINLQSQNDCFHMTLEDHADVHLINFNNHSQPEFKLHINQKKS